MERVILPQAVGEALDTISRMDGYQLRLLEAMLHPKIELSSEMKVVDAWLDKGGQNFEILLQALVNGYEVEETPHHTKAKYRLEGALAVAMILGIEGVNNHE